MPKTCTECNQPGTLHRRVQADGYHKDCRASAETTQAGSEGDDSPLGLKRRAMRRFRSLLASLEQDVISLEEFASLVSQTEGCTGAFDWSNTPAAE